jgi:hypothetical protein
MAGMLHNDVGRGGQKDGGVGRYGPVGMGWPETNSEIFYLI